MRSDLHEPGAVRAGMIGLATPNLGARERELVLECLDAGWVSSAGPFVDRFEKEFATAVGARFAVATASGTAALHVALRVAGVDQDDEVVLPSLTFIAPANAVRYQGAFPVFVDVDPGHWQIAPDAVRAFLKKCRRDAEGRFWNPETKRRVRALLPVDLLGHPADHDALRALAQEYGLAYVEDATESLGASYKKKALGTIAPVTAFSFNGNKLITTGGGGMLVTDDEALATRAKYLTTQAKDDPVEFVHGAVGYNYRLTNLQAALGIAQLERLDAFVATKRHIAARYGAALGAVPGFRPITEASWAASAWWLFSAEVDAAAFGCDRRELSARLERAGVQARPLWQALHESPAHQRSWSEPCPVATRIQSAAISLPSSTHLADAEQDRVIAAVLASRHA